MHSNAKEFFFNREYIQLLIASQFNISGKTDDSEEFDNNGNGSRKQEMELPLFDWKTIADATDNFSEKNKLGEGGFGSVFKVT